MTLAELQRALTSVDSAAVLVPPRVMEAVIRQVLKLSTMVWSVPHAHTWIVDRTILFRHVDQADLALAPDQLLPGTVILLSWPNEEDLLRTPRANILLQLWRQLFHASIHQAVDRCWENGTLTPARLREHIETIGPTAFEEIQTVLKQENILLADANERAVFDEFAAVFLELNCFSPTLLPSFFPGLSNPEAIKQLLDRDLNSDEILRRTRLPGALEPIISRDDTASEANVYFYDLEASSAKALEQGNMVQAAIQLQRAVRVAPADQAPATRKKAESVLNRLVERLRDALEWTDAESAAWTRLLPILLDKADQGSRPAEASLLYELQNICLDHEREIYKLDLFEYVLSAGRRPLKRPLPSQRLVRITRTLRGAMPNLTAARLSDQDRRDLDKLLQDSLHRSEERVRNRFRPIITNALQDVGLSPRTAFDTVSFRKMIEELLDRVIEFGFLTFSDLRDTISRNQLKLPDLVEPQDFIRGDALIRLDRRLATVLDGVYRPGEFYLRWLERFTALQFGTKLGRLFTRFITLPVGGGFLIAFAMIHIFEIAGRLFGPPRNAPLPGRPHSDIQVDSNIVAAVDTVISSAGQGPPSREESIQQAVSLFDTGALILWVVCSTVIFALIHSAGFRKRLTLVGRAVGRGLRAVFIDVPLWFARHDTLHRIVTSTSAKLVYWYVIKPGVLTALAVHFIERLREGWLEILLCFLAANFLINSRPGEVLAQTIVATVEKFANLIRAGLIPGLVRFIVRLFKNIMHSIEGALFTVDEWLRFRGGESQGQIVIRSIATLIWMPISYLARFNLVVLIEPCFHPLKFPIVTVATKFYLPFVPMLRSTLTEWFEPFLGQWLTIALVWWLIFWGPDVFGFIFWEMKENWFLFRANRQRNIAPVPVGLHGESIRGLFQPGFHSGTLPKLFARIRQAQTKAIETGNFSVVRHDRGLLAEVEESLLRFAEREFCTLLEQSPAWKGQTLMATAVELSGNRIRFHLAHPHIADQPLLVTFENRADWLVAGLNEPAWLAHLSSEARSELHNALALFYKIAGIDLVREQIRSLLPSPADPFDFTANGLIVWPADRQGKEMIIDLGRDEALSPTAQDLSVLSWDPDRVLLSRRALSRDDCNDAWPSRPDSLPVRLLADIPILPSESKPDTRESAA